jgi:hypothetical protein
MTYKNTQNNLKTSNKIKNIEKEMQLIRLREKTMANPKFQEWMRDLNISQSYEDRSSKINAYDLQMQYDVKAYSKLNFRD